MFKEHKAYRTPKDENAKIWRYMDFTKFVSMLDKSALFFTRVDKSLRLQQSDADWYWVKIIGLVRKQLN